jgi:surface antigen
MWLGLVPAGLAISLAVLPTANAGTIPLPIRTPASGTRLATSGPPAAAYPFSVGGTPALDAYGFVTGQCTSFVAWWLNAHGYPFGVVTVGPAGPGWFLNASSWDIAAREAGYQVGSRPVVGAIAQWRANESSRRNSGGRWSTVTAGATGHVAVVVRVLPDGQVDWLDYGWNGQPTLHHGTGFAPRYLYVGVVPPTLS